MAVAPACAQKWAFPDLQVPITEKLTKALQLAPQSCPTAENPKQMCVNWIGDYAGEIFNYVVAVAGLLAVVVMMVGGFLWLASGGNQERAANGKAYIASALSGLVLVLFSYTLLNFVNPDLVNFQPIRITLVEEDKKNGCSSLTCPSYTTCKQTTTSAGGVSVTAKNSYECLSVLKGKCEVKFSVIDKFINSTTPYYISESVDNEEECRKKIDKKIIDLINKYPPSNFNISLSKYEYIPSTNTMYGETIANPSPQEEYVQ